MIFKKSNGEKISAEVKKELKKLEKEMKRAEDIGELKKADDLRQKLIDLKLEVGIL